jgi:S1-C subfamily serine protease
MRIFKNFLRSVAFQILIAIQIFFIVLWLIQFGKSLQATLSPTAEAQDIAKWHELMVTSAVETANPAVVSIIVSKDLPVLEQELYNPFSNDPNSPFKDFLVPRLVEKGKKKQNVGGGTGFIAESSGYIVTNRHVVEDKNAEYTVLLNDERKFPATVLAISASNDIAVIKIEATNLPTLKFADSSEIKLGQTAIAIGNALGEFRNTVSVGVVSGLQRSITATGAISGTQQLSGLIQTDASINRGNSGGPLLNLEGKVMGMNTAVAENAQSIGFAIPSNDVRRVFEMVKTTGKISQAYLGVRHMIITKALQEKNKLPVSYGALITKEGGAPNEPAIVPGSPAEKAGLQEGDIILEVRGKKVTRETPLISLIAKTSVGEKLPLKVLRGKKKLLLTAVLEERRQ